MKQELGSRTNLDGKKGVRKQEDRPLVRVKWDHSKDDLNVEKSGGGVKQNPLTMPHILYKDYFRTTRCSV